MESEEESSGPVTASLSLDMELLLLISLSCLALLLLALAVFYCFTFIKKYSESKRDERFVNVVLKKYMFGFNSSLTEVLEMN